MFNDTITLFNRLSNKKGDVWYPTMLNGVHIIRDKACVIAKFGTEATGSVMLNIHYNLSADGKKVDGKLWVPPKEWKNLSQELLGKYITFAEGQGFDFFWVGDWKNETPIADEKYGVDGFYDYMNKKYDYVYSISQVSGPYTEIPHFEIVGK